MVRLFDVDVWQAAVRQPILVQQRAQHHVSRSMRSGNISAQRGDVGA
jgi:hypothetical protein